jgi:hypothetical protein
MARSVVLLAALVLCTSALALAHAGGRRALEFQELGAEAVHADPPRPLWPSEDVGIAPAPATAGADQGREGGGGSRIVDILWFVFKWANEALAGDRRKDH